MALEPVTVTVEEEANPELVDMTRRFRVSLDKSTHKRRYRHRMRTVLRLPL